MRYSPLPNIELIGTSGSVLPHYISKTDEGILLNLVKSFQNGRFILNNSEQLKELQSLTRVNQAA